MERARRMDTRGLLLQNCRLFQLEQRVSRKCLQMCRNFKGCFRVLRFLARKAALLQEFSSRSGIERLKPAELQAFFI
jgi:hypothetical protein